MRSSAPVVPRDAPAWTVERELRGEWTALGYWAVDAAGEHGARAYAARCRRGGCAVRLRRVDGAH